MIYNYKLFIVVNQNNKIGLSSPKLTPLEKTSIDGSMKKEKNVLHKNTELFI